MAWKLELKRKLVSLNELSSKLRKKKKGKKLLYINESNSSLNFKFNKMFSSNSSLIIFKIIEFKYFKI